MSNLVIPDGGTIGSASDTDAISISSGGNVTLSQTLDGGAIGSAVTMSANQACVKTALNASGSAPIYACRAWVNFNGSSGSGSGNSDITIRGSGNVSSITDGGTGTYTVNFTTAMPDTNYCSVCIAKENDSTANNSTERISPLVHSATTTTVEIICTETQSATERECDLVQFCSFR